jgi:putative protease
MPRKTPELLAPAGSLAMLDTAFAFGATAIYAGQPRYSLRVRNNDFGDLPVLADGIPRPRRASTSTWSPTSIPHGAKIKTFIKDIAPVIALKPDALIMSDPGLIMMVRENFPRCPSTCRCRPTP